MSRRGVYYDKATEDAIADHVATLLDVALSSEQDRQSGETFQCCHLCATWDDHQPNCPIPLLERWQDGERWSPKG